MAMFTTPKAAMPLSHDLRVSAKKAGTGKGHGLLMLQAAQTSDALRTRIADLETLAGEDATAQSPTTHGTITAQSGLRVYDSAHLSPTMCLETAGAAERT